MRNIPFVSFVLRYWLLLGLLAGAVWLELNEQLFQSLGMLIYLPALAIEAVAVALLIRHVFFGKTLDADAHSGLFVAGWRNDLTPRERVLANLVALGVLFLGVCWIAAALAK